MRALFALAIAGLGCGDNRLVADAGIDAPDVDAQVDASRPLAFVDVPSFTLDPTGVAPLTGKLVATTTRPTRLSIKIDDPDRSFTIERPALAAAHDLPVLGFRPDRTHTVTVTATAENGDTVSAASFDVTTAPLPSDFPNVVVDRVVPAQIEPGLTLLAMSTYMFAVDEHGEIVWVVISPRIPSDVQRLSNGNVLASYRDMTGGAEIDVYGSIVRQWHTANTSAGLPGSIPVATDSFHHELAPLPDGTFVALSSEVRAFSSYPTSETDPTPQTTPQDLVGDVVVVFEPDGTIVHEWSLFDIIDPYRVAYNSFGSYWSSFYHPAAIDWSHANAAFRDPSDGSYLVSLRHQDAVIKVNAAGELVWILGTHDNWPAAFTPYVLTPVGAPFDWPFHQHAPRVLPNGNILVFDNGNYRVSPPTPIPTTMSYSRAVEYRIDPVQMTIEQVWEYDGGRTIFAAITGDVDVGAVTGNVIVTFGGARSIIEVTHDAAATPVFRLFAPDTIYRSERVRSLYP